MSSSRETTPCFKSPLRRILTDTQCLILVDQYPGLKFHYHCIVPFVTSKNVQMF